MEDIKEIEFSELFVSNTISISKELDTEGIRCISYTTFKRLIDEARKEGFYFGKQDSAKHLEQLLDEGW